MKKLILVLILSLMVISCGGGSGGGGGGGDGGGDGGGGDEVPADDSPDVVKAIAAFGSYMAIFSQFGGTQFAMEEAGQCTGHSLPCTITETDYDGTYGDMGGTGVDVLTVVTSFVVSGTPADFTFTVAQNNPTEHSSTFPNGYPDSGARISYNDGDYIFQASTGASSTLDGTFYGNINVSVPGGDEEMQYGASSVNCTSSVTNMEVIILDTDLDPANATISFNNQSSTIIIEEGSDDSVSDAPNFRSIVVYDGVAYTCYTDTTLIQPNSNEDGTFSINESGNLPSCTETE